MSENIMKLSGFLLTFFWAMFLVSCGEKREMDEIQLTNDLNRNFNLDNRYNFSPDDKWLVYDTRTDEGGIGGCRSIEKVNVETGEIVVLYQTQNATEYGPGVGAASYSHLENKVIFIHGLLNCNAKRPYEQWRRTGVIIDEKQPGNPIFMDARDVTPPFTPGALRGGTHDHEWSGDGLWIGFTYNDAIMKALQDQTGKRWNLRTIGVSRPVQPVKVDHDAEGENNDGIWFSVLVVKVVPEPRPGSDEISHAADDCWIGVRGYRKPDGTWQRARAFLGTVRKKNGEPVKEVFVVDIPERIDIPAENGPLEGTELSFPMPPKGTVQRRLTHTAEDDYPGCEGILRCSPDGNRIAYRAKDNNGINQVFFISPLNNKPVQVTYHESPVQSDVRWHHSGELIYYLWDNSIVVCDIKQGVAFGQFKRITPKSPKSTFNIVLSHNGKLVAFNRNVSTGDGKFTKQIFLKNVK